MNTFIISSKNFENALLKADEINHENKIDKFDIEILEFEKALGIEDVRNIQKKIFLKPFRGEFKCTIIVLENSATIDAQNSMLKLLEEPPTSSKIILITDNFHSFLPTILSRAKIITLEDNKEFSKDAFKEILNLNNSNSLNLAAKISEDKNEAVKYLENAILGAREEMLDQVNHNDDNEAIKLRNLIHHLELTHYDLKNTNVNTRLALENLFLNLS